MLLRFARNRTSSTIVVVTYGLYLSFLELSLRSTSKVSSIFRDRRSYVSVPLSGTGYDILAPTKYTNEREYLHLSSMKQ